MKPKSTKAKKIIKMFKAEKKRLQGEFDTITTNMPKTMLLGNKYTTATTSYLIGKRKTGSIHIPTIGHAKNHDQ